MSFLRKIAALAVLAAFSASTAILAESPCKGLPQNSCEGNSSCTWVNGYKKKDGTQVDSYCREKPGKGQSDKDKNKDKTKIKDREKNKDKDKNKDKNKSKDKDKRKDKNKDKDKSRKTKDKDKNRDKDKSKDNSPAQ